jgi:hypothetical protein
MGAAPTALGIIGLYTQPSRAGLTFGSGPPGLDERERSAVLLLGSATTNTPLDSILNRRFSRSLRRAPNAPAMRPKERLQRPMVETQQASLFLFGYHRDQRDLPGAYDWFHVNINRGDASGE